MLSCFTHSLYSIVPANGIRLVHLPIFYLPIDSDQLIYQCFNSPCTYVVLLSLLTCCTCCSFIIVSCKVYVCTLCVQLWSCVDRIFLSYQKAQQPSLACVVILHTYSCHKKHAWVRYAFSNTWLACKIGH